MNRSLRSRLTGPLRVLLAAVVVLAALVLADSAYLVFVRIVDGVAPAAPGSGATAGLFFQTLLIAHSALGIALVALVFVFAVLHLRRVWVRRGPAVLASGVATVLACAAVIATGLFLLSRGAGSANRWVWWAHVVTGLGAPALYVAHRSRSVVVMRRTAARRFGAAVTVLIGLAALGHAATRQDTPVPAGVDPIGPSAAAIAREMYGAIPPGFVSPHSEFFPSPAMAGGDSVSASSILGARPAAADEVRRGVAQRGFYDGPGIGSETCVRCHPDVTRQWEASAHRFSSFNNPFYEASIEHLRSQDPEGVRKSRWCGACHDPALLFTGGLDTEIARDAPEAQAGLTCLACHAMEGLHDRTGNGNYVLRPTTPRAYLFSDVVAPGLRRDLHDAVLRARPDAHRRAMLPSFLKRADGCGTCHKVSLREPVNDYRWLRGQNELDAWESSGVSLEGIQTFYQPEERKVCQDCHMPPEPAPLGDLAADGGTVRSHRFAAANSALPAVRGDTSMLRRIDEFLSADVVSLDIFGYRSADGRRSALALSEAGKFVPGAEVVFDVVVRNRGVGHAFPGGTIDSNEAWLGVRLLDSSGRVMAASGLLDEAGRLDEGAHVFRALFVDSEGRPIDRRNPQDIRATVYRNVIDPGSANLAHFRLVVPSEPGQYTLEVRLNWRKFDADYSEFVFGAVPEAFPGRTSALPLPITAMARRSFTLDVLGERLDGPVPAEGVQDEAVAAPSADEPSSIWVRWNDYGIAALREGSTRTAALAFGFVATLAPERPDGPLNQARVALADGEVAAALDHISEAGRRAPLDPRVAWLRAEAELADGSYDLAVQDYRSVLAGTPRHRLSLLGLGRALYLDGQLEPALEALDDLLAIDPESLPALYHRMLVLRSLGRTGEADEAEALVGYFEVDETAGRLTRSIRSRRPGVNAMAQPVRTHELRPVSR